MRDFSHTCKGSCPKTPLSGAVGGIDVRQRACCRAGLGNGLHARTTPRDLVRFRSRGSSKGRLHAPELAPRPGCVSRIALGDRK